MLIMLAESRHRRCKLSRHPANAGSEQLGVQCDLGVEDLGNRAVLLGVAGHPSDGGFVQVRHLGAQSQGRPTDAEALALWVKSDRRLGTELGGGVVGPLQPPCGSCEV
jgi:hypothetical protein